MLPRLKKLFLEKPGQVLLYLDVALKAYVMNLDKGIEILQSSYSKDLRFGQGSRHDSVLMAFSVVEAWPLLEDLGLNVKAFIGDSAHDANALYLLLDVYGSKPVIDLRVKPEASLVLNKQGISLCPKGFLMQYWGFDKKKNRFKWRCPKKAGKKKDRDKVCCDQPCTDSKYGYIRYTKPGGGKAYLYGYPQGVSSVAVPL
jgi:hypothetical protein